MSTGTRVPLAEAAAVAESLVTILGLGCERIEVAGSIRRRKPDIGDIELVVVPLMETTAVGLFEQREVSTLDLLIDTLIIQGDLRVHPTDPKRGDRYAKLLHRSGLQLDLFMTRPETFGMIYLIRTGPREYSERFVTDLRRRSLHAADGELHRGWLRCGSVLCQVVPTPDETHVYAAAGWPFVPPELRA